MRARFDGQIKCWVPLVITTPQYCVRAAHWCRFPHRAVWQVFIQCAVQAMHEGVSDDLLGDFSHISIAEGCFWLSVTNLVTIGYGSIVSLSPQHFQQDLDHWASSSGDMAKRTASTAFLLLRLHAMGCSELAPTSMAGGPHPPAPPCHVKVLRCAEPFDAGWVHLVHCGALCGAHDVIVSVGHRLCPSLHPHSQDGLQQSLPHHHKVCFTLASRSAMTPRT